MNLLAIVGPTIGMFANPTVTLDEYEAKWFSTSGSSDTRSALYPLGHVTAHLVITIVLLYKPLRGIFV